MDTARNLERMIFDAPELDREDYHGFPEAAEEELEAMESLFAEDTSAICLFLFIRVNDAGKRYVELYVWDQLLYPDTYERFIICEGFRMREEDEEEFLYYTKSQLYLSNVSMDWLYFYITKNFPEWHFVKYTPKRIGEALEHMYFASHRCGAREILYKAQLNNIAYHLDQLPDYNIIGTTPETIVGYDLPLKLLRILNRSELISALFDQERITYSREAFERFSGYIDCQGITKVQWRYLEELVSPTGLFTGENFNRTLYERLSDCETEYTLKYYKTFFRLQIEYPELRKMSLPKADLIEDLVGDLDSIHRCSGGEASINDLIRRRKAHAEYEYAGKDFIIVLPKDALDMCKEAIVQGNCLMEYIRNHAEGSTTILFVRKPDVPEKSFVTMEVSDGGISQVYGRYNEFPEIEVYHFLEEYARAEKLHYDPYELIIENSDALDNCEYREELWEYAENYISQTESDDEI